MCSLLHSCIKIWLHPITKINTHDTAVFGNYFSTVLYSYVVVNLDNYTTNFHLATPQIPDPPPPPPPPKGEILEQTLVYGVCAVKCNVCMCVVCLSLRVVCVCVCVVCVHVCAQNFVFSYSNTTPTEIL